MRKFLIILTSLVFTTYSFSQIKKDTTQFKELKEVVVSSSRFSNNNEVITNQVE
jgi:hypothetical protein